VDLYATDTWRLALAAIRAEPADDLNRLKAADLLDEAGQDARAAFVRLSVEAARLGPVDRDSPQVGNAYTCEDCLTRHDPWPWVSIRACKVCGSHRLRKWRRQDAADPVAGHRRDELAKLLAALRSGHAAAWFGPLPGRPFLDRGFVGDVRDAAWDAWHAAGDAVYAAEPVRTVTLSTLPDVGLAARVRPGAPCVKLTADPPAPGRWFTDDAVAREMGRVRARDRAAPRGRWHLPDDPPAQALAWAVCQLRWPGVLFDLHVVAAGPDPADLPAALAAELGRRMADRLDRDLTGRGPTV
jgi:uncharacterized protein (TIGR02996 family)